MCLTNGFKKIPHKGDKASLDDVDSSTDTTVGWTKNIHKPNFLIHGKKTSKTQDQKRLEICQN